MKANEIQIGDWVYSTFSKLPCKVTYLKLHESGYAYVETTNVVGVKDIESLSPIPLTPEILEKNGFRIIFDGELHVSYFQDIESFHTEVNVDKIGIYNKLLMLDGLGNGVTIVECKYVHQLQHALRLCGINHEIIM